MELCYYDNSTCEIWKSLVRCQPGMSNVDPRQEEEEKSVYPCNVFISLVSAVTLVMIVSMVASVMKIRRLRRTLIAERKETYKSARRVEGNQRDHYVEICDLNPETEHGRIIDNDDIDNEHNDVYVNQLNLSSRANTIHSDKTIYHYNINVNMSCNVH